MKVILIFFEEGEWDMLYFSYDTENYKKQNAGSNADQATFEIGNKTFWFYDKLKKELDLEVYTAPAYYEQIGVPINSFLIHEECLSKNLDELLEKIVLIYSSLPISELGDKSLNDIGIEVKFCKKVSAEELEKILSNSEYITEQVLWKNMTVEEKADVYARKLQEIGAEDSELIIVDPYLFKSKEKEYCDLLADIIKKSKVKRVIVITDKAGNHYDADTENKVKRKINIPLDTIVSQEFHDRFWIVNRKKAFTTGTSLNGIGKKISLMMDISDEDVKEIMEEIGKIINGQKPMIKIRNEDKNKTEDIIGIQVVEGVVENIQGAKFPSTGGIGTTIFYVIGAICVLGAGVFLVIRRRMTSK